MRTTRDASSAAVERTRTTAPAIRVGPAGVPSHERPDDAVELQLRRAGMTPARSSSAAASGWPGTTPTASGNWLDAGIRLSIHAPLAAFLGHAEYGGRKHHMAIGMLDHSAGIAVRRAPRQS